HISRRSARAARAGPADGREPVRVRRDEWSGPVSVLDLIRRESLRLRRGAWLVSVVLPTVAVLGVLTAAAAYLADGRWLTAPPFLPLLAWMVGAGAAWGIGAVVIRRLRARSAPQSVAAAIESEQG